MKALLIDNYDSFTYNLFQLWVSVTGVEPIVVRNDDQEFWRALDPGELDAILVSPGPGRPERDQDFGISRAALTSPATAMIPLLGVCLGHQGLCLVAGGSVVSAPEPVHGRPSPISHDGTGLFAGLPSPFAAVRYHSLMVADLPAILEITATTPGPAGDIVMAVRHRDKPHWGVQFHPESIATEYGHRLLANFCARAAQGRAIATAPSPIEPLPTPFPREQQLPGLRLLSQRLVGEPRCPDLFTGLFANDERGYWLDSSAVIPGISRLSILGGGGPLSEWVTARAGSGEVSVEPATDPSFRVTGDVFSYLGEQLARRTIKAPDLPFEFALGYVGFLGYELRADSDPSAAPRAGRPAPSSELPDAAFLFSDRAVVVDHENHETWLLALTIDETSAAAEDWLRHAAAAVRRAGETQPADRPEPAPDQPGGADLPIRYRHSAAQYTALILECQRQIRAGESYEICLTNEITVDVAADPLSVFRELRRISPAPYAAFFRVGDVTVLSASPERFLKVTADGHVQAKPIKGTRRRGHDPVDDAELARDLGASEKDRAENLMIVDLLRNDLGRVAVPGSVEVTRLFDVETFAAVHQLVSTVEAQLRPELAVTDCVRAAFPGGSMTGAPKLRTMQIIDRLEGGRRGVYSGALGYFSLTGAADLSIVIRTLVVHPDRVTLGVGGAVIALSDPAAEVDEMLLKSQAPLAALTQATT